MHFTVQEQGNKKPLNTPGGEELLARLGGSDTGIPYHAFLNGKGELIVNSRRPAKDGKPGGNVGHPFEPHEIDWFMVMLAKAAPGMTAGERAALERRLRAQKK